MGIPVSCTDTHFLNKTPWQKLSLSTIIALSAACLGIPIFHYLAAAFIYVVFRHKLLITALEILRGFILAAAVFAMIPKTSVIGEACSASTDHKILFSKLDSYHCQHINGTKLAVFFTSDKRLDLPNTLVLLGEKAESIRASGMGYKSNKLSLYPIPRPIYTLNTDDENPKTYTYYLQIMH